MARKPYDMKRRLKVAHQTAHNMSEVAGRLLQDIKSLEAAVRARDLLIEQLKEQLAEAESQVARAMKF